MPHKSTRKIISALTPAERIDQAILIIRGIKVLLDADLAALYGVSTKALNQAVRRNLSRFPSDFMLKLIAKEKKEVVTNCDHLSQLKFSPSLPLAFTEQGIAMLSSVLNSDRAIAVNIEIMRAFVRLRQLVASNEQMTRRLNRLERTLVDHDEKFATVFEAIRELMSEEEQLEKSRIGYDTESKEN